MVRVMILMEVLIVAPLLSKQGGNQWWVQQGHSRKTRRLDMNILILLGFTLCMTQFSTQGILIERKWFYSENIAWQPIIPDWLACFSLGTAKQRISTRPMQSPFLVTWVTWIVTLLYLPPFQKYPHNMQDLFLLTIKKKLIMNEPPKFKLNRKFTFSK